MTLLRSMQYRPLCSTLLMCHAPLCRAADTAEAELKTVSGENGMKPQDVSEDIPKPSIKIDNEHDAFATIVCISYGDRLGELLDTVRLLSMAR